MKEAINDWKIVSLLCLTLGLAPFIPEPHIWGKIQWVWGGATGMKFIDWFDVLLHGFPWVLLFRLLILKVKTLRTTK
ncbi:hypothetical protein [Pareuzebyella sediminis]|uniref:hypothetical protein n=1 Tax=Pareuzebyella sediminis TaxID=2607998 RepID=UPI0011EF2D81|nr:hypothetical protein [Pareuzebyella sediminis]